MLLIPCPWCGPRPEVEFTYGGEAHIARPANPSLLSDTDWADFLYNRKNPKGPTPNAGGTRTAAAASSIASAIP